MVVKTVVSAGGLRPSVGILDIDVVFGFTTGLYGVDNFSPPQVLRRVKHEASRCEHECGGQESEQSLC